MPFLLLILKIPAYFQMLTFWGHALSTRKFNFFGKLSFKIYSNYQSTSLPCLKFQFRFFPRLVTSAIEGFKLIWADGKKISPIIYH